MKSAISRSFGVAGRAIPAALIGIQTNNTVAPTGFVRGAVRFWDCKGGTANAAMIRYIAPSSGVYDWSAVDAIIAGSPGSAVHVCLGCPPDWMVTRAGVGGAAYGGKSNMVPDDLDAYCNAVTLLAQRIQAAGVAAIWDTWNEITGPQFYGEAGYAPLGPYTRRVAAAIRAVTPNAIINAPNTNQDIGALSTVLQVSDGAGGKISDHCNGASWHYYHDRRTIPEIADHIAGRDALIRAAVPAGWVISLNEAGIESANPRAAVIHATRMAICAALGAYYVAYTVDHGTYGMSGQEATWNAVANVLANSALTDCYLDHGQSLVVETTRGRVAIRASGITVA